jgi:hypothetical protein
MNRILPRVTEETTDLFMEANADDLYDITPWLNKIKKENPCIDEIIRHHAQILHSRGIPEDLISQYLTGMALLYMLLDAQATVDATKV